MRTSPFRLPLSFCLLLAAALGGGCGRSQPPPQASPAWDWSAFPVETSLLIAQLPAAVEAPRTEVVRAPISGTIHLLPAARDAAAIAAGSNWAEITPDPDPDAARDLKQDRADLADRRERYVRYDRPAELDKLDEEIATARETVALARFAEHSPELFAGESPVLDPHLKPAVSSAQAEAQLKALEDRRSQVASGSASAEPADIQALAASIDRRQRELDEKLAVHEVSATIAGTLRLAVSREADGTRVEAGQVLATLADDSDLEVVIRATLPLLHEAPAQDLTCTVSASGGAGAIGQFSSWGVDASGSGLEPVMRFKLPPGAFGAGASDLEGVRMPALIHLRLPAPARIVPKLTLAAWDEKGALASGWRTGLAQLFPGCRLIAEGRASLAIDPGP